MSVDRFELTKDAVLSHINQLFEQIEEEMVMSHQEKYTLLEDAFEQASDESELRVAFEQWYSEHADDVEFDHSAEELWDHATNSMEDDLEDEEEQEVEEEKKSGSFDSYDDYDEQDDYYGGEEEEEDNVDW